jgi:tight adherence protein B
MQSHDMEHVALVAMLQRETGGASAEVIDQVSDNIRGRMEVRRLVHTLTAQGRLARWIVSAMPIFLVFAILIIFPEYLDPLFHETVGQFALVFAAILVVAGSLVIKRIVEIKV